MALTFDPNTNTYIDPATGQVYMDAGGTALSSDPGLTNQARRNLQVANQLYAKVGGFQQNYEAANAGQNQLGRVLDRTINGTGAPSVAATQLQQTVGNIAAGQESQAAGATGVNAAIARYAAMQNTAQAQAQANQSGALLRANEVSDAERAKAGLLGQQAGEAGQMFNTSVGGANAAAATAGNDQGVQSQIDEKNSEANKALVGNLVSAGGSALALGATKSDVRSKKDVKDVPNEGMEKLLKHLSGISFEYKDPEADGEGERVGVAAQDVQKGGPIGEGMVIDGKRLKLDNGNAVGAALAAVGYLASQVRALRAKRGR